MNDIIVIGSNYSTTLGIVRSLGMAGYGVRLIATTPECHSIIHASRYITKAVISKDDFESVYEAMEALRGSDEKILVIPANDLTMKELNENKEEFSKHYAFPYINESSGNVIIAMNKAWQKEIAAQCGLSVPCGANYSTDTAGMEKAFQNAQYPCVTKSSTSSNNVRSKDFFHVCHNESELREAMLFARSRGCLNLLVEQYIPIEKEYTLYGLSMYDKVLIPACLDSFRSGHDAHVGVTAEGKMRFPGFLGEDLKKTECFVKRSGLNGLFCIDIIHSQGKNYFIEMNLRYGASGYAVTMGGANLPGIFAHLMIDGGELDEAVQMQYEPQFLNEKVELDDYRVGFMSWREYKQHQRGDKVRFMKSDDDPEPWKEFKKLEMRKHLARILRGKKRRI